MIDLSPVVDLVVIATAAPCTWEELADTSAEDSVLVETLYSPSLARCKALCEADSTCTVVIFSSSVCRKFHDVTPRADDGWTYLRKSCPPDSKLTVLFYCSSEPRAEGRQVHYHRTE